MENSKWLTRFFWFFYFTLICFCAYGILSNGVANIQTNLFFFVLLGLLCLPLLMHFIPSLETLKAFGVELKLREKIEETEKHLKDLTEISDNKVKDLIFKFVSENSLTPEGKEILVKRRREKNEQ